MTQGTQSQCPVTTWREGVGREVGVGFKRKGWTHADEWQKPSQHCKVIILQLKIKEY